MRQNSSKFRQRFYIVDNIENVKKTVKIVKIYYYSLI